MPRIQFRHLSFVVGLLFATVTATSAQSSRVTELTMFRAPFQVIPGAIAQLPDGRIFGFYRGGLNGGIYQVTANGAGGFENTLVYEFGESQAGPAAGYFLNGVGASVTVAASDGWIYFAGLSLSRFNPDMHIVQDLHSLGVTETSQPTQLSMGIDGQTLFGAMFDGRIYSYDTAAASFHSVTTTTADLIGVLQMKDGNLMTMSNVASPQSAVMRRLDRASGIETAAAIVQDSAIGYPPAKGDDGEIFAHTFLNGDDFVRVDATCFCLEELSFAPQAMPQVTTFTGARNGYLYYNNDNEAHRLQISVTPPVLERLASRVASNYQMLPDGTLVMFDDSRAYALNTATAVPDTTPTPLFVDTMVTDGADGFPSEYTQGADGMLYGSADDSRTRFAPIYRVDPNTGARALVTRIDFGPDALLSADGTYLARMVLAPDGRLYGTYYLFVTGYSAIFRFDPATGAVDIVHEFPLDPATFLPGPDGSLVQRLAVGSDGSLYGTTAYSDDPNFLSGTIFKLDPVSGAYTRLATPSDPKGFSPNGPLVESSPGVWVGTYYQYDPDQPSICSRLFRFNAATSTVSHLHSFVDTVDGCAGNYVPLARATNGLLYGTTERGGIVPADPNDPTTAGLGVFFRLDVATGAVTALHRFLPGATVQGPRGDLLAGADGLLYSSYVDWLEWPRNVKGAVRLNPTTGAATSLAQLPSITSALSESGFHLARDGRLFGGTRAAWKAYAIGVLDGITVASASGSSCGPTTLSATLKTLGVPVVGRSIAFSLNGVPVGSATTNSSGVATLNNVDLTGIAPGTNASGIGASFAGDAQFPSAAGSGSLTVIAGVTATPGTMLGAGVIDGRGVQYEFGAVVVERADGSDWGGFELLVKGPSTKDSRGKITRHEDRFLARSFINVVFSDDPAIGSGRPRRPSNDTVVFSGAGDWNGHSGYRFEATAQMRAPGRRRESLQVAIYDSTKHVVATFDDEVWAGAILIWSSGNTSTGSSSTCSVH